MSEHFISVPRQTQIPQYAHSNMNNSKGRSHTRWPKSVIPALHELRQKNHHNLEVSLVHSKFQASLN